MNKQKGFIQIPMLILIILSVLVVGGTGYGISKYQQSKVEESKKNEVIETLSKEVETLKNKEDAGSQVNVVEKNKPAVIERIIEKPVVVEQKTLNTPSVPQAQTPPQIPVPDTKKLERQAFDTFWQNYTKATNELTEATNYITNALKSASGSTGAVASAYAQNAIDACNSGYQLNLNSSVPNLPFSTDLNEVNRLVGNLGSKCKQMAQAFQESFKYSTDIHSDNYNPYKAKDLAVQGGSLMDEFLSIWKNQLTPASDKVIQDVEDYF